MLREERLPLGRPAAVRTIDVASLEARRASAEGSHSNSPSAVPPRAGQDDIRVVLAGRHLPMLDGLRAVAIALVMMFHFGVPNVSGALGVNIFFVLSGFLITWLLLREQDQSGRIAFGKFYARRTLRIFPAYYVFLAIYAALSYATHRPWTLGNQLAAVTYSMDWYAAFHPETTRPTLLWSLAVEEHFYLVWPLLLRTLAARGPRTLVRGTVALIVAGVVWRTIAYSVLGLGSAYVYYAFDARLDNLAVGCLLAIALTREAPIRGPALAAAATLASRPWLPFVTVALIAAQSPIMGTYRSTVGHTLEASLAAVLVLQLLQLRRSPLWGWLDSAPMRFLGRLSYSLYLYHAISHTISERIAARLPSLGGLTLPTLAVAGSLLLAAGSHFLVERPFLALKRRYQTT